MSYKSVVKGSCDKWVEFNCPACGMYDEGLESEPPRCECGAAMVPDTIKRNAQRARVND